MKEVKLEGYTVCINEGQSPLKVHVVEDSTGNAWVDVSVRIYPEASRALLEHENKKITLEGEKFRAFKVIYDRASRKAHLLSLPAVTLRIWADELAGATPVPLVTARDWVLKGRVSAYKMGRDWLIRPTEKAPR